MKQEEKKQSKAMYIVLKTTEEMPKGLVGVML
jgi:hypothetical protein